MLGQHVVNTAHFVERTSDWNGGTENGMWGTQVENKIFHIVCEGQISEEELSDSVSLVMRKHKSK